MSMSTSMRKRKRRENNVNDYKVEREKGNKGEFKKENRKERRRKKKGKMKETVKD